MIDEKPRTVQFRRSNGLILNVPITESDMDRFWEKVDLSGDCWIWTGSKSSKGYGSIAFKRHRVTVSSHRLSYMLFVGEIPKGMMICHRCDTPACVRPEHLFYGTAQDNSDDLVRKGLSVRIAQPGSANPSAKLDETSVLDIRRAFKSGRSISEIASKYPVKIGQIQRIVSKRTWRHI